MATREIGIRSSQQNSAPKQSQDAPNVTAEIDLPF